MSNSVSVTTPSPGKKPIPVSLGAVKTIQTHSEPMHFTLNPRDMPVVRKSGNLKDWRAGHASVLPISIGKDGSQVLKAMRTAREKHRS
jgi:hypothetical protein